MFELAHNEGVKRYVKILQESEFATAAHGYTFVAHQQEVGTSYFGDAITVSQGGQSNVSALTKSSKERKA